MAKTKSRQEKAPRRRKQPTYKSFRLAKRIKPASSKPLPGVIKLTKAALLPLRQNKKLFIGIILIYLALTVIFTSGIGSSTDFVNVKNNLKETFGDQLNTFNGAVTLFSYVLASGSASSNGLSGYQLFITLIISLVVIWSIRQVMAGEKIGIRQAFYQGIYPLVPFVLVLLVITLQLVPLLVGNFILSTIFANGLVVSGLETVIWWILFGLLALLSLYMVISSIFGLYISTLPNMTPVRALRSARGLVLHRRVSVGLRLLCLPILGFCAYVLVLMPLIIFMPVLTIPTFFLLGGIGLFFAHSYLYNLYRALL